MKSLGLFAQMKMRVGK